MQNVLPIIRAILRRECDADREHFLMLAVDTRMKVIGYKVVSSGSLAATLVHPPDVFIATMTLRAASIILAHSHPRQDPTPSPDDYALSSRFIVAGEQFGIPVIDHLVLPSAGAATDPWCTAMPDEKTSERVLELHR